MVSRRGFLASAAALPLARGMAAVDGPVRIAVTPAGGIQPRAVLNNGAVHLVFFTGDPQRGDIFYTRSDDFGGSFPTPVRVNSQPGSAIGVGSIRGAQIAVGRGDRVHVAWNGSDAAEPRGPVNPESGRPGSPMLYARLNDRGTAFEPQRNLMQWTFGLDGGGSLAADGAGNVYVGWHGKAPGAIEGEAGRAVWIARSQDDGSSFTKERPATAEPTGACGCCGLKIFADSRGDIYGLYRSAKQNVQRDIYLLRSTNHAATFSAALLHPWSINACPMSSMALIETGREVWGAWETRNQVYFAPVSGTIEQARSAMVAPPGQNPRRKYPALARNRRGETLLAWVEGSGWQRGGILGWQIFDRTGRPGMACKGRRNVPVWSFPAVLAHPDESFTILV